MSPTIDPFWLSGALSSFNELLLTAFFAVGLIVSLRRWNDRGRSARAAAAGFGLGLLADIGGVALTVVNARFSPTAIAAPDYSSYLWPMFFATALRSCASVGSILLIMLALWFAWREADRARRDPVT